MEKWGRSLLEYLFILNESRKLLKKWISRAVLSSPDVGAIAERRGLGQNRKTQVCLHHIIVAFSFFKKRERQVRNLCGKRVRFIATLTRRCEEALKTQTTRCSERNCLQVWVHLMLLVYVAASTVLSTKSDHFIKNKPMKPISL